MTPTPALDLTTSLRGDFWYQDPRPIHPQMANPNGEGPSPTTRTKSPRTPPSPPEGGASTKNGPWIQHYWHFKYHSTSLGGGHEYVCRLVLPDVRTE